MQSCPADPQRPPEGRDLQRPSNSADATASSTAWKAPIAPFESASPPRAVWQLTTSLSAYVATWVLMYWTTTISWWLTIPLAVLAGGLLVRLFIIFHDCGHGSFFRSRRANDLWGIITGILTFTPYHHWRWEHGIHHATAGKLRRRGVGDIWTLTIDEYRQAPRRTRLAYRLARNPVVLFILAPFFLFLFWQRRSSRTAKPRERYSVWWTNAALAAMVAALAALYGPGPYIAIQLTILGVAGSAGIWLFYVQHQYEDTYWAQDPDWTYTDAALLGSSYYKLPRILQWFTGNIGFHHIHHLSPRIPNYHLERCHRSDPLFEETKPLTLWSSLKSLRLRLWDESEKKLVGFRGVRRRRDEVHG